MTRCHDISDQGLLALFHACPDLHEYRLFETRVSINTMQLLDSLEKKVYGQFPRISAEISSVAGNI